MSSHHIVREKQEPALLVLGADEFEDELLGQLLEWNPTVITTPDTAELLISRGIKVDWVVNHIEGDFVQSDIRVIQAGNKSFAMAALNFLIVNGYPAVNIIINELHLNDFLPYVSKINLVVFYNKQKIIAVTSGFSKWKPAGEQIEILTPDERLQYDGLTHIGRQHYETTKDGFFSLHFGQPFLLIAEAIN